MTKYWSTQLEQITAYVAGEQPQGQAYIKLNTNENPYPPSGKVIEKLQQFKPDQLRRYPDPEANRLKEAIANAYHVRKNEVYAGNGSDEVLAHAFMAFFKQVYPVYFPDITYSFYPIYCAHYGIEYRQLPLTDDFDIDTGQFPATNGGIIFPNPNAPTGKYLELDRIHALLDTNRDSVVIIDEAYIDFGGESCVSFIAEYPNLLVVQTLSKSRSLAGLRVGYALGDAHLIAGLNIAKNSFNSYPLDSLAITGAVAAINDYEYYQHCQERIIDTREWLARALTALTFEVVPSKANFLMIRNTAIPARRLYEILKDKGILVRYFDAPRINNYIRLTIGTREDMETFLDTITEVVNQ